MTRNADQTPPELQSDSLEDVVGGAAATSTDAGERPPMLKGPKRQHFLPRFYLDGFARDGLVAVYDRTTDTIRLQQPINTAVIGHFYTLEDEEGRKRFEIEAMLSAFEGKAKIGIDKLIAGESALDDEERSNLAVFLALAANRTPDMVSSLQHVNSQLMKQVTKMMFRDVETTYERLRSDPKHADDSDETIREKARFMVEMAKSDDLYEIETNEKWAVGVAIEVALEAAPYLADRHWRVVHRKSEKQSFITCDAPVYLTSRASQSGLRGVGFGSPDAFIAFALNQSCVLEMFGESGRLTHDEADREYVRMVNLHLARRCQRFVVGRDEALLRSLADEAGLAKTQWKPKFRVN